MRFYALGLFTGLCVGWCAGWIDAYFLEPKRRSKRLWDAELRRMGVT